MEQNNGDIFTQRRRSTDPLEKLQVWQNSSAVFFVHADSGLQSVAFVIGTDRIEAEYYPSRKCWRVYVQPLYLAVAGSFCYTIRAVDECGYPCLLGSGTIEVKEAPASEPTGGGQPILPTGACAYNPQTGKYHRLVAVQDPETGVIVVSVNQTGETP